MGLAALTIFSPNHCVHAGTLQPFAALCQNTSKEVQQEEIPEEGGDINIHGGNKCLGEQIPDC